MKVSIYLNFLRKISVDIKAAIIGSKEYSYDKRSENSLAYVINYEFALNNSAKFYPDMDKDGIPFANYLNSGYQYNPTRIASYGLAHYNLALFENNIESQVIFLRIANWFQHQKDNLFLYNYNYESLKAPWISCMAQGQGISVLCRAYIMTNKKKYLIAAQNAAKPLLKTIKNNGLIDFINEKWPILEEFPFKNKPWHVLNGFLYALIGIIELREIDNEIIQENFFLNLIKTAERGELWTHQGWTTYDLQNINSNNRNTATMNYHNVHIAQYKYLAHKFPDRNFKKWAEIWQNSRCKLRNRLLALNSKIRFRLTNPATRF